MFAPVTAFKNHPAVGGVPGRELTNFPNAGGARITVPQKCGASFFAVCQMPEFNGQRASVVLSNSLRRGRCFGQGASTLP